MKKDRAIGKVTHGDTKDGKPVRLYRIWAGIKTRVFNSKSKCFKNYGGRGISICSEWKDNYIVFREWAVKNGYADNLTIDRIDNNGNYEPTNCRWLKKSEQSKNRRNCIFIEHKGDIKTVADWSKITGISRTAITNRYRKGKRGDDLFVKKDLKEKPLRCLTDGRIFPSIVKAEKNYNIPKMSINHALKCRDGHYKGLQFVCLEEYPNLIPTDNE